MGTAPTILVGYVTLALSAVLIGFAPDNTSAVTVALVLLGLGWSAATVAGAALLTEASAERLRTRRQGRSDSLMSLVGALGAIAAGGALGTVGFNGLALLTLPVLGLVVALSPMGRH